MDAVKLRAEVSRQVKIEHGEEKCQGRVVEGILGNSAAADLRMIRFKECHANTIT
jgi:hypothetical protein